VDKMEITGLLSKIEHFQVIGTIEKTIKESEQTATINEKIFLLKLNIYLLNEIYFLAGKIVDLFFLNWKSLLPIEDEKIINIINNRFGNIPEREFNSFNEHLNYLTNFRIGYIDGLIDGIENHKKEVYSLMMDEVYNSEFEKAQSINQFNTDLKKNIIEGFYPLESDPVKLQEHLQNKLEELKTSYLFKDFQPNQLTGFTCNLHPDTVKEIFNSMATSKQISGNLTDFHAIFANTSTPVKNPVKWLLKHNGKPNKTALFSFIKLMLNLDELPREILRQANNLFISGKENVFPDKYSYPSIEEQKSSIVNHFKPVKELIKKNRPV
jgi:hypothetical protein